MAEEIPPPLKHFLTCSLCTEIFKDPVSLSCHHSFCSSCLQDFWAQAKKKNCPVCKRKSSKDIVVNFSIKELADSFAGRLRFDPSDEAQVVCTEPSQRSDPSDEAQVVCTEPSQRSELSDEVQVKRSRHQELEKMSEAMFPHLKVQRVKAEGRIREHLLRFLRKKEEARVKAMREEEEARVKAMIEEEEQKRMRRNTADQEPRSSSSCSVS